MKKVFVNGCFDILHLGHIELFKYAKSLGDHLTVAIDSDDRIKQLKGCSRPINNQHERIEMLRAIRYVDDVRVFHNSSELEQLTYRIQPDIMIVGSDYKDKPVIGSQHAKELRFFERVGGYATTKTIQRISNR